MCEIVRDVDIQHGETMGGGPGGIETGLSGMSGLASNSSNRVSPVVIGFEFIMNQSESQR